MNEVHINQQGKTLLKFSSTWCQPCKMLSEIIKQTNLDNVELVEIDIDTQTDLAVKYHIRSVPTLVLLDNGVEIKRHVGMTTQSKLEEFIR